jgi:glycosyltransferase involved in cell wall biosynthesis
LKISVVMPVYNEKKTIREILRRIRNVPLEKEIICVDDFSSDGTWDILQQEADSSGIRVFRHPRNLGKGAAVATALRHVEGDVVVIQDADLEYSPEDYPRLVQPIIDGTSKVVYGSRFLGKPQAMYFWNALGNKFLTFVANLLFGSRLSDIETCHKIFTADIARELKLVSPRWGFDPEITAKILRMGHRIHEVPISYASRSQEEKKINWKDGFVVLFALLRFRYFD